MTDYGVTPEGFVRKPLEVILQEINEYQWANVSSTLDVSPESPQGQINAGFARQLDAVWELAEILYHSYDPDAAEDFLMQNLAKITGTARSSASKGLVTTTCNLDAGTVLLAGVHYANVAGQTDNRWTPREDFTADAAGGDFEVEFESEFAGSGQQANAGTLTVINTSLSGWNSITNAGDATPGEDAADDEVLREDREADLARAGSATLAAIKSNVGDVAGVVVAHGYENRGNVSDANGLPPHSIEIVVDDGETPAADDDAIAQAIFDETSAGIQWYSSDGNSGTALNDEDVEYEVGFTRVEFVDIYLSYTIATGVGYVGDTALKTYIKEQAEALYAAKLAPNVLYAALIGLPLDQEGVTDVTSFFLDVTSSPAATANIQLSARQKTKFDTANIVIS